MNKNYYNALEKATGDKKSLYVLQNYKVENNTITATNLETAVIVNCETMVDGIIDKMGLGILNNGGMPETSSNFTKDDFPELPKVDGESVELGEKDIENILYAYNFVSNDDTRPVLEYVVVEEKDGKNYIMATDGYKAFSVPTTLPKMRFYKDMLEIFKGVAKIGKWRVIYNNENIVLTNDEITIYGKTKDYSYPDLLKIVEVKTTDTIKLGVKSFEMVVKMTSKLYQDIVFKDGKVFVRTDDGLKDSQIVYETTQESGESYPTLKETSVIMPLLDKEHLSINSSILKSFVKKGAKYIVLKYTAHQILPVEVICE